MRSGKLTSALVALGSMVTLNCVTTPVFAWGDEGHEVVGLIAQHYLDLEISGPPDNDLGGNNKKVKAVPALPKSAGSSSGKLHGFWDNQFVAIQGKTETTIAKKLIRKITQAKRAQWSKGTASDWAIETYGIAKVNAYGPLPTPDSTGTYTLSAAYVTNAKGVVADQLSKAGVRLAFVLNEALK